MRRIRYAVVGLGHIAQAAVLPAFANARRNSELVALVSGNPEKRRVLGEKYDVEAFDYEELDALLGSGAVDAVYIALPNTMHHDVTLRAARAGVHVLCEKPMAMTEQACIDMIRACDAAGVKLMIAYRLHFERGNLEAIDLVRKGKIGEPRYFSSVFSFQVRDENIRLRADLGGGPLFDIGVYCLNAARAVFGSEPMEAAAFAIGGREPRFEAVEEAVTAILRFPDERLASFTCSFGAARAASFRVVGTEGDLHFEPAFSYGADLAFTVNVKGRSRRRTFPARDQFAPELIYFSECILRDANPEPDGREGLADVRALRAIELSLLQGRPIVLAPFEPPPRPAKSQSIRRPPVREPSLVQAEPPTE